MNLMVLYGVYKGVTGEIPALRYGIVLRTGSGDINA